MSVAPADQGNGRFGAFGGRYVPETLVAALDELEAAWKLFTPVLNQIENDNINPELYPYGSRGPIGAHYLASRYNVRWGDTYN